MYTYIYIYIYMYIYVYMYIYMYICIYIYIYMYIYIYIYVYIYCCLSHKEHTNIIHFKYLYFLKYHDSINIISQTIIIHVSMVPST